MKFLPILILAASISCVLCIRVKKQSIGGGTSVNDGPGIGSDAGNGDGPHVYGGGCNLSNGGIGQCFYCPRCPGSAGSFDGCPDSYICGGSSGQYPPPNQECNDDSR
uniref:Uncharacterized protein n=1 Tax=Acrobeloides nanus TaxID=290746 RepID=A0A914CDB8_9BILA